MYAKRRVAKKRPVRRVARKSRPARKSITKIVKSIISRQAENKAWFDYGINQSITTTIINVPTWKNLLPILAQGTGHSSRIGNEVRVKSAVIRGHVNILPYNLTTNSGPGPVFVKIWILSAKKINTNNLGLTDIASNFFDIVNSFIGFQGNMLDLDFTVNKDAWIVHATKMFKIGAGYASGTGPVGTAGYFDNSPMSVPFYFSYGKNLKTLKYDDSNAASTSRNMFIVFQAVQSDGTSPVNNLPAEFHYSNRVEYEDM